MTQMNCEVHIWEGAGADGFYHRNTITPHKQGVDPCASRTHSERSTIRAKYPHDTVHTPPHTYIILYKSETNPSAVRPHWQACMAPFRSNQSTLATSQDTVMHKLCTSTILYMLTRHSFCATHYLNTKIDTMRGTHKR